MKHSGGRAPKPMRYKLELPPEGEFSRALQDATAAHMRLVMAAREAVIADVAKAYGYPHDPIEQVVGRMHRDGWRQELRNGDGWRFIKRPKPSFGEALRRTFSG